MPSLVWPLKALGHQGSLLPGRKELRMLTQGSLHYTPEHCLVMVVSPYFGGKNHVSNGRKVSFKEPCDPTSV